MKKIIYVISIFALVLPVSVFAASSLTVETKPVVDVTYNGAQISANITAGDTPDNVYWFEWGISGNYGDTVFKSPIRTVGTRYTYTGTYDLHGLAPSTQYFYRVVAENQTDHVEGQTIYFTTKSYDTPAEAIVIVKTMGTTAVKDTDATLHAYVAPHTQSAHYWFEWGTDRNVGGRTNQYSSNIDGGEETVDVHSLVPGTTYYYRVAAENDRGIVRGAILSFQTTGTKPVGEQKKNQVNTTPDTKSTSAASAGDTSNTGFFGAFGNSTANDANTPKKDTSKISSTDLSGSVGSTVKDVMVSVTPIGKSGTHETIEYKVAYAYNRAESAKKAQFEVTLPSTLVYIGDTTANELRVRDAKNGARTYVLSIGTIKQGDTRSFSIIAMTTADAKGIPQVNADLVFTNKYNQQMVAGVAAARTGALFGGSSSSGSTSGAFPTTMIMWLIVVNVAIGSILGMIRAKEWFAETQARLKETEEKAKQAAQQIKSDLESKRPVPAMVVVPENVPQPERPVIRQFEQELNSVKGEEVEEFGLPGAYTVTA
jgi:hypothetical protein